jgi:putative ABC transport system permease protein
MLKNYFTTAWRNMFRNKLYSGITILGLTIGLAVGILVLLWVQDETSFDGFHRKAASIYRVNSPVGLGKSRQVWATTTAPVGVFAMKEVPGIENAVRIVGNWDYSLYSWGDKSFNDLDALYADSNLMRMFDFTLLRGNPSRPWPDNRSILITARTAQKFFGKEDPIGKVIQGNHKDNFTVSGVLADFPDNSSIDADLIFPMSLAVETYKDDFWHTMNHDWGDFGYTTFLQVQPGVSTDRIGRQLIAIQKREAPWTTVSLTENAFELQPLTSMHLREADGRTPLLQTVRIFLVVAIFILLIASINYVNLSTARAMLRAREVSVRKIIGAARGQLFAQFIVESVLFYMLSLLLALLVIALLLPYYNQIADKHLVLGPGDLRIWRVVAMTGLGTLAASAIYPALLLSSFRPLEAMRDNRGYRRLRKRKERGTKLRRISLSVGIGNALFRKLLVTTQFAVSIALMIATVVIARQLNYIRERDPGYDRSQIFTVSTGNMREHRTAVSAVLGAEPAITGLAGANLDVVENQNTTGGVDWDGKLPNSSFIINPMGIDERFIPLLKMKMAEGANFTGAPADSTHYILNETAVRMMGIKDPVGKRLKVQDVSGTIIGVVKDFNFMSMREQVKPAVLRYRPQSYLLYVKTEGRQAQQAVAAVRKLWKSYNPGFPFEYSFLDERFDALYRSDRRTGGLFELFAGIALFVSCLGLFGLAAYTAQVRTREIGIRKVLGASVGSIVGLLSRDFLVLVGVAIVIASPLAWLYMRSWLQDFAYRMTIDWWVFLLAGAAAIVLALLTIGWQSVRAAMTDPVKSLRSQ